MYCLFGGGFAVTTFLCAGIAHAHDVITTVHMHDLAGDAGSQIGTEKSPGIADFLDGDVTPHPNTQRA